ncbi:CATRA conflict system CASPASE/TPR repeat-associated protein [Kutzneria sp. 744]|uniref:CATRA conflict system CASPASE/TPR repeat-associated protein n=1 Tax=Kutzneria sp. (strain 744) TaxID=345341 RepID=UPI0003EEA4D0|nr:CATRA conflict system CASPASE/TPR repeat-associated protein [Kutzneria sp. 744]EWM12074.1 LigA protein [Kutzneria sp. 744]
MSGESVVEQELIAHFYAFHDGEDAEIRTLWSRCGEVLGAVEPITSTGLPVALPDTLPNTSALVAARWDPGTRLQAIMRMEHEVVNVSLLFRYRIEHTWRDFDHVLDALTGTPAGPLLGSARLYVGLLADGGPGELAATGRAVAELLPAAAGTAGWWHEGLRLDNDLLLWETGETEDDRVQRRLMVLAAPGHGATLSAWTWSDGGATHLPPFARYLMHVAKIRDQLRVRRHAPDTAELCRRIEDVLARCGSQPVPPAVHIALARTITSLEVMAKTVRVSWENAVAAAEVAIPAAGGDPVSRDRLLATWFDQQLRDDAEYLHHYDRGVLMVSALPSARGEAGSRAVTARRADRDAVRTVLVVADEWFARLGGISTLNRSLCAALVGVGAQVYCLVPKSSAEERADADAVGVQLVDALSVPGISERESLMRRPPLPADAAIDTIIGHGRVTGQVARALAQDHYPTAVRLHLVHVEPDQVEWHKLDRKNDMGERAEERSKVEIALAAATRAVPVGPRLEEWMRREMHVEGAPTPVRFVPGFDVADPRPRGAAPGVPQILLLGRAEDAEIKGIDIAAGAIGHAMRVSPGGSRWELLIRGAPKGQAAQLRSRLLAWINHPAVDVTVRNYTPDRAEIDRDLRRASLVLMPSRVEGFGLVGHEAIRAGAPCLVSGRSGLGMLLADLPGGQVRQTVVPVTRTLATDIETWGSRIAAVMGNVGAALGTADDLRTVLAARHTWAMAARSLIEIDGGSPGVA